MAIPIQCPECHKRYQAPDHMAGRRVKCKHCAVVFLIAGDNRTDSPDFDLADLNELSALGTSAGGTAVGGGRGGPGAAGKSAASDPDAPMPRAGVLGEGGAEMDDIFGRDFVEAGAPRTNKLYVFPMSRLLDRWLPALLLAIGVVWVCREAWARNNTGLPWVGAFRAGVFLLAFFASVYPFTLLGVRAAARRLNYELPSRLNLRVMGSFAVPAALAAALWLIYEDTTGLLLGCAIGVAVAMPVLFLLLRLLPREAPVTFGYAAGSFVLSIVVAGAVVFALNLMLVGILRSAKTEHALAVSPFGPGFRWDGPYRPSSAGTTVVARGDDEPEGTGDETEAPATSPSTNPSDTAAGGTTRPAVSIATGDTPPDAGASVVDRTGPSTPTVSPDPPPTGPQRIPPPGGDAVTHRAGGDPADPFIPGGGNAGRKAGGIVKDVRTVIQGDLLAVVRPAVPGPWLAVVRQGVRGSDRVERWDTQTWKPAGEAQIPRDPEGNTYSLSPDGQLLAYISRFPSLSVQVYSFAEGRPVREIRLKTNPREDWGQPRIVGFSKPEQIVVHWRRGNLSGIELHATKGPISSRQFAVEDFDSSPGTYAISPDGQSMSILWREHGTGGIASYSLTNTKLIRSFPIGVLDWNLAVRPAGLAYSPDGTQVAAVIEGDGQGLFAVWPAVGKPPRPLFRHVVPVGGGEFGGDFQGSAFEWLDGGKAYVLYGASVFETETGRFLGDLGIEGVRAQIPGGDDAVHLIRADEAGRLRVDAVTLDLGRARDGQGTAGSGPTAPGAKPATRRAAGAGAGAARDKAGGS